MYSNASVETLDKWPDFLDWASKVRYAHFDVEYAAALIEAEVVSRPDPAVWQALFTPTTGVHNHQFEDERKARVISYPVTSVHDYISKIYGDLGLEAGDELPDKPRSPVALERALPDGRFAGTAEVRAQSVRRAWRAPRPARGARGLHPAGGLSHVPLAPLDLAAGRHVKSGPDDPRENAVWRQHKLAVLPGPLDFANLIDFHAVVSALNQYPYLLRLTGLAVDLRVKAVDVPAGSLVGKLALIIDWNPAPEADSGVETLPDGQPFTITRRQGPTFAPEPRGTTIPISEGLLRIDGERLRLIQMDVDGAGITLRNMTRNLICSVSSVTQDHSELDRSGTPTLRTAGLQLVEINRHLDLHKAFDRSGEMNDALNNGDPIELYAEDLIRGYHADMLDETTSAPWRSLCRRDGTYDLLNTGETVSTKDEEGIIRMGAQEAIDQSEPQFENLVKISELLFNWSGWSLTAPRFGLTIGIDDTPQPAENSAPPGLPLETSFSVRPGSLPPLRFGHAYRTRVRLVDLAGNALPFINGDTSIPHQASAPLTFRRFEPVLPPANALVEDAGTLERPNDGESMGRMAIRSLNETPADNLVPTAEETRRHVVPPRTSQAMAEQHGLLDDVAGRPDPSIYSLLASRDGNLDEVEVLHEDPLTGSSNLVKI